MNKTCEQCGDLFEPKKEVGQRQRFCNIKCSGKWHYGQRRHEFTCQGCGHLFKAKKPDRDKFCSRECAFAHKAAKPVEAKVLSCKWCEKEFVQSHGVLWCSHECRKATEAARMREYDKAKKVLKSRRCKECGKEFTPEYGNKRRGFCSDICGSKYSNRVGKATRRARIANAPLVDNIDPIAVLSRDKWKCHICGRKTPKKLRGTIEDNAPEMDHIIPLARGGTHTWDNVACACRKCNSDKGDRIVGQLKLPTFVALGI